MKYLRRCLFFSLLLFAGMEMGFAQVQVALPDTAGTKPDTMQIPLRVGDLTGLEVISAEFKVNYNPNVVEALGITQTGALSEGWMQQARVTPGQIRIVLASTAAVEGAGTFLYIRFRLLPDAQPDSTALTFEQAVFNEGEPATTPVSGKIRIRTIHVTPNGATLFEGEQQQFGVTGDVTLPVTWGTTNSGVATIDSDGLLTAHAEGFCRVFAEDTAGLTDTSGFVIVRPVELRDLTMSIHNASYTQQLTFNLPIYLSSVNSLDIISAQFNLHFNPNHLMPLGVSTTETMTAGWNSPAVNYEHDYLTVAIAGTEALVDSGVLLYVEFRVRPTATGTSQLSLSDVLFNEDILANTVSGTFTPLPAPDIAVTPDQKILTVGDHQQFQVSGGTAPYSWSTTNPAIATIDNSGLLSTVGSGAVRVAVEDIEAFTDTSGFITVNDLKVSFPDNTIPQGYLTDVPIYTDRDVSSFDVISFQLSATYLDTPAIWLDSVITTGTLTQHWNDIVFMDLDSGFTVAAAGVQPLSGSGPLMKLRFYSASDAPIGLTSEVKFSQFMMNEGQPSVTTENGSLEITSTGANVSVYLPDTSATPGETILIPVMINQPVDGLNILSYEFQITYDNNILTAIDASNSGTMSENFATEANIASPGTLNVSAAGTLPLGGMGTLVNLEFQVGAAASGVSDLAFTSFLFNEGEPNAIPFNGMVMISTENHDPIAVNDTITIDEDSQVVMHVLRNDSDPDGDPLIITEAHVTDSGGSVSIDPGDTTLTYTPGENWTGDDQILYTISDGLGGTDQAIVLIHINPVNDPPADFSLLAPPDSTVITFSGDLENQMLDFSWSASSDVDGDALTYGFVPTGTLQVIAWGDTTVTTVSHSYAALYAKMQNAGYDMVEGNWTIYVMDGTDTIYADNGTRYLMLDGRDVRSTPEHGMPVSYQLFQNYPNPFNPVTQIKYALPEQSFVNISVYDLLGNRIVTLVNGTQPVGFHTVEWNGRNEAGTQVGAGFYFCRLYTKNKTLIRKMVYMK